MISPAVSVQSPFPAVVLPRMVLAACPHCAGPVRLAAAVEDGSVQVVREDGSRAPVEGTSAVRAQQLHFAEAAAPEAEWTLERWWRERCRPEMVAEGTSRDRISQYETYIRRWQDCCANHWSVYPVVRAISPASLGQFRTWLVGEKITSGAQADKHISGVSTLLRRAERAWILPRVPTIRAVAPKPEGLKFRFSLDEVDALIQAAWRIGDRIWPQAHSDGRRVAEPAIWWQAYFVGGWNYGFRPQEWWSYEGAKTSLTWPGVITEPTLEIEGRDYANQHGWLSWTQDKTGHCLVLPMNAAVRHQFDRLREQLTLRQQRDAIAGDGRRVWDFPLTAGTAKPGKSLSPRDGWYAAYWAIVQEAGLQPKLDSSGKRITHCPMHFRKSAHTEHRDRIGSAADWITGHRSGKSIGERNYYVAIDKVTTSILAHPQPPSAMG